MTERTIAKLSLLQTGGGKEEEAIVVGSSQRRRSPLPNEDEMGEEISVKPRGSRNPKKRNAKDDAPKSSRARSKKPRVAKTQSSGRSKCTTRGTRKEKKTQGNALAAKGSVCRGGRKRAADAAAAAAAASDVATTTTTTRKSKRRRSDDTTGGSEGARIDSEIAAASETQSQASDADKIIDDDDDDSELSSLSDDEFTHLETEVRQGRFAYQVATDIPRATRVGKGKRAAQPKRVKGAGEKPKPRLKSSKSNRGRKGNAVGHKEATVRSKQKAKPIESPPQPHELSDLLADIDPRLLELSARLEHRETLAEKPPASGKPLVWAESRQALCETLPYFKKPQGGCYSNDGHVYGFLFDSIGHCREYMDPDLIICRAGGGMEADSSGEMVQKKHQSVSESQPMAIINDMKHKNPLIVICGNRNANSLCQMPHHYCVLDWFKPVALWSEKTAGKGKKIWTTVKYRLERLNHDSKTSWSAPEGYAVSEADRTLAGPLSKVSCKKCRTEYPQIYLTGWMCLNAECLHFWHISGQDVPYGKLPYNPAFLLHRERSWASEGQPEIEPGSLRPEPPKLGEAIGDHLLYVNTRGICCPLCGRCNPRRLFRGWICETPGCPYTLFPSHKPIVPTALHTPWSHAPNLVRNRFEDSLGVKLEVWNESQYKICKYIFEGVSGCFIHAAAGPMVNQELGGPDDMLIDLQTHDVGLERRAFVVKKVPIAQKDAVVRQVQEPMTPPPSDGMDTIKETDIEGTDISIVDQLMTPASLELPIEPELLPTVSTEGPALTKPDLDDGDLMTAFSMNYGMPYKFVASGASRPFEEAPKAVISARARLNWAARTFLKDREGDRDFNEQLIFAYLQGQKIEYHDDGEFGLGPRIATLSLGGRAQMYLRVKQKHYIGCSKGGMFTEEEPIPCSIGGSDMYLKRKAAWSELQAVKLERSRYMKRRREIPIELGLVEKRSKRPPDLLTITLSHGDIVLMDGYDMQKYMEHKIVSEGHLRFALTCRTVLDHHLKPEERPPYTVLPEAEEDRYTGPNTTGILP